MKASLFGMMSIVLVLSSAYVFAQNALPDSVKALGKDIYQNKCSVCHTKGGVEGAPGQELLSGMSSKAIYAALITGKMKVQGQALTDTERKAVAQWLTGRALTDTKLPSEAYTKFYLPQKVSYESGWGGNPEGTGFVKYSGINADNVGSLKLKWAFAFPEGTQVRSKPAIAGDWLIVGGQYGEVYAIHKRTGKIGWEFKADAAIRGAVAIAPAASGLRVYFADYSTNVYALNLASGRLIWKKRSGKHPLSANTGSVAVSGNTVLVPLTSFEINSTANPDYNCCTSSGELVALDAVSGEIRWRHRVIPEEAKISGKKKNGADFYGPSGAPVWCSPTVDVQRGLVYIGTGENYTNPPSKTSDAIQAIDIKTGKLVWTFQATQNDAWNLACPDAPNCPEKSGPDFDFGMAPLLIKGGNAGKDILVVGQKSGMVHGLDPVCGHVIWQNRVGKGGMLGGIHWGMASDGRKVYVANADNFYALNPGEPGLKAAPGLFALDVATGKTLWYQATPACPGVVPCIPANSAAPLALPGLVFAGTLDGHIRAYKAESGEIIWDFNTIRDYQTVNGVKGKGGSLDGPSPVVSGNMLFVNSGYGMFGEIPGNLLIAFELDNK
ncbi:PQQ-binding-like beta-propeller repeat protein [Emticicia sp. CRIBPO]|uniref:outer membrane protein assembly factor BamB family protein n=1 Tax=Emticicia sp. CRIBPO TaxID=2683258 RepID=UPI001412E392|nr:PQQ-binding-like beta-propeller repeat protein [Emticicia sp. CRIBPO]NBA87732.1 PQQ-binding-like beta-propeller repeat protein [Emticicia sp. CRIBPO]